MARALHPAMRAGTASMMAVEGSGAEPGGHVEPDAVDGPRDALAAHARHGFDRQRRGHLRFVKARDVGDRAFERRDLLGRKRGARFAKFLRRSTRRSVERGTTELLREPAHRGVALGAHRRDDARRLAEHFIATLGRRARQRRASRLG